MKLEGTKIVLRALEPDDLEFLYQVENDEALWEVSNTLQPYSKYILKKYLDNAHQDLFEAKQLRLVICRKSDGKPVGLVDLYDFDPHHRRAGLGIVIAETSNRGQGLAKDSIEVIKKYAFGHLDLNQLYASISQDNESSIHLFEELGFLKTGIRRKWLKIKGGFKDEYFYQLLNE